MTTTSPVTGNGFYHNIPNFLNYLNCLARNSSETRVLIITGSHGSEKGESGFSNQMYLDYQFYKKDCNLIGVDPEDDNCIAKPEAKAQSKSVHSDKHALLEYPEFENMSFNVLNIKHLSILEKHCLLYNNL